MSTQRYAEKPLLRLLECYVLWAIEELPEAQQKTLQAMAPKLQSIYGGNGQWQDAIAAAMHMSPAMPAAIRKAWPENLEIARINGTTLPPQTFAEMFVDQNFAA